jgi:hypothetical protein
MTERTIHEIKCTDFIPLELDFSLMQNCFMKPFGNGYLVASRTEREYNSLESESKRIKDTNGRYYILYELDKDMNVVDKKVLDSGYPKILYDARIYDNMVSFSGNKTTRFFKANDGVVELNNPVRKTGKNVIYYDGHYVDFFLHTIRGEDNEVVYPEMNIPFKVYRGGSNIIKYKDFLLTSVHTTIKRRRRRVYEQYILVMDNEFQVVKEIYINTDDCMTCEVDLNWEINYFKKKLAKVVFPMSMWLEDGLKICSGINDSKNIVQTFDPEEIIKGLI